MSTGHRREAMGGWIVVVAFDAGVKSFAARRGIAPTIGCKEMPR
jgi:hypothetical protein